MQVTEIVYRIRLLALVLLFWNISVSTAQNTSNLSTYSEETILNEKNEPIYVRFNETYKVDASTSTEFIELILFDNTSKLETLKAEKDELGYNHIRYSIKHNGVIVYNKMIVAHFYQGKLISINGDLGKIKSSLGSFAISETAALKVGLNKLKAKKYKWENKTDEQHMREMLNDPTFTYYPKLNKVLFEFNGALQHAYQFVVYAEEPLCKMNFIVNASNGKILQQTNVLCMADVPATAATKYSGTQSFTVDQNGPAYRLRESGRGLGIETFDLQYSSAYASIDFTNATTSWTTVNSDQGARDAHWGAEKTYDYFKLIHNRNSLDNLGFKLLSYVHYLNNYNNAFWDGQRITLGDGNSTNTGIWTALDMCGHEFTHGLTEKTSNLFYANQSGALNESYSDIFGTLIENYGKPSNWNWKIGTEITIPGQGFRDMQNPNALGHPDTYLGTFWYTGAADNGGVHTNSGVSNFWFYLLSMGGTGTNDLSNTYTVNGISMASAAKIAFRALTVYYTSSTNFTTARALSIQAARDIFGNCSNEVIQTTNAWHAVGVGTTYSVIGASVDFTGTLTNHCTLPAVVSFSNGSINASSYIWNFGDNTSSTATHVVHTYTANGTYTVELIATGCNSSTANIVKPNYIFVNSPAPPTGTGVTICQNTTALLSASGGTMVNWYASPSMTSVIASGSTFITPTLTTTTSYYAVKASTVNPLYSAGLFTDTDGGYLNDPTQYLVFDVLHSCFIESVVMYANSVGNRIIELRNSSNVLMYTTTVNLAVGANTVTLNYQLLPGTNYKLGLNNTSMCDLYHTNMYVNYPYPTPNHINIVGSSTQGMYFYFYAWMLRKLCLSNPTMVTATVNPAPVINLSTASTLICNSSGTVTINASPAGGTFFGPGLTGNSFNPLTTGNGTFTIIYNYTDPNTNCSSSNSIQIVVSGCTGSIQFFSAANAITFYPNPANDHITVANALLNRDSKLVIFDVTGRKLIEQAVYSNSEKLDVSHLANGVYFLEVKQGNSTLRSFRLIKE